MSDGFQVQMTLQLKVTQIAYAQSARMHLYAFAVAAQEGRAECESESPERLRVSHE